MANFNSYYSTNIGKNQEKISKNILFRADSSSAIGIGHIMRDLVLAKEYEQQGHNIFFACRELEGNIIAKIPYEVIVLKSNDVEELQRVIEKYDIDMLVIDHYEIGYEAEKQLSILNAQLSIMAFDDTYKKHYCDILLNHNICADESRYKDLVPDFCEIRCGKNYTLIRDEFKYVQPHKKDIQNKKKYDILVAMGGSDPQQYNFKIIDIFSSWENIHFHFLTTSANENIDFLKSKILDCKNMTLYVDIGNVAELIKRVDFAIVTPSVIINELVFMELPFIAIKIISNQKDIYNCLKSKNIPVLNGDELQLVEKYVLNMFESEHYTSVKQKILALKEGKE